MNEPDITDSPTATAVTDDGTQWFALKTRREAIVADALRQSVAEIYFPTEVVHRPNLPPRERAIIPRVLFVRATPRRLLELEEKSRLNGATPFWIYRYPNSRQIQPVSQRSIDLLRLLTATDTTRCEIFNKQDFREGQRVIVTGGPFQGYQGSVQRVRKNRHVIVRIEGICLVMLPFIHPDLLSPLPPASPQSDTASEPAKEII